MCVNFRCDRCRALANKSPMYSYCTQYQKSTTPARVPMQRISRHHDTNAGKHSHALQIDEKNSKNCAQKHMNAQVCAVRWAHRRHRNAQPMGTDSSTFRPSTGDVTLPESGSWCISHVVAPCSRRIQHKAGTRGAKVDLLALPPRQAHYGLKC